MPRPSNKSVTLRKSEVDFIRKYLDNRRLERIKEGKADTIISVIREGLILWAEREGLLDEFAEILKRSE